MNEFETMAATLDASGDYRVIRRMRPRSMLCPPDGSRILRGIMLDIETTGLDPLRDEIIELAMVPFSFAPDGRIFETGTPFHGLREPSIPIPPEITKLTGIDDRMVAGQSIDPAEVTAFAASADLIVAHNAAFDRKFSERFCDVFRRKIWGCSMSQIPWAEEGFEGTKLGYLLYRCGLFHDGHRAVDDCYATIEVLARPLPVSGMPALGKLLTESARKIWRIWAIDTPFVFKDALKARRYRWNGETNGQPRAWYLDLPEEKVAAELDFLRQEIYQRDVDIPVVRIPILDRFSDRA